MLDNDFTYRVTGINTLSEQMSQIFLQPEHSFLDYKAGQYVHVLHQNKHASLLSIACAPQPNHELEFQLFHPSENLFAQDLMYLAKEKGTWHVQGPYGHSTVDKIHPHMPIIFLARGTGFAPVKAVIEVLIHSAACSPISLYWFMPQRGAFYLQNLLASWKKKADFNYHLISDHHHSDFSILKHHHQEVSSTQIYASGSPDFVHKAYQFLQPHGLQRGWFISDVFE